MRILICIPCLLTGGTEIQTLNTVHALVQGGHEVTVACYFEHTPYMVERYRKAGAKVLLFSPEGTRVEGYRAIPYLYKHLRCTIKAVRPDVTHVQYMAPGAMVILLLWLMGVKNIIATAHTAADIYKDLRLIHFLQRHCLRAFTCITERAERSFFGTSQLYTTETVLRKRNHFTIYNALPKATALQSTVKVCANEQESNSFELLQRQRERSVGSRTSRALCIDDEENFSSPEEKQLVALQPKLCDEVTNGQQTTDFSNQRDNTEFRHDDENLAAELRATINVERETCNEKTAELYENVDENLCQVVSDTTTQKKNSAMSAAPSLRGRAGGEAPILGVVSRLESIKGMDLVVPAFAEVLKRFPEVRLLVVGDGSLRATMEQQAAALGCADRITWVGRQPQEELNKWYGQMDIVLMPSRSEGFGLTAIETMANGCVMVASNVGGLPEVVRDGVCGLLHRTEDVHDMAEKACALLDDAALYDRLRTQALSEVKKYSFERYAEIVCNLYNNICNEP